MAVRANKAQEQQDLRTWRRLDGTVVEETIPGERVDRKVVFTPAPTRQRLSPSQPLGTFLDLVLAVLSRYPAYIAESDVGRHIAFVDAFRTFVTTEWTPRRAGGPKIEQLTDALRDWLFLLVEREPLFAALAADTVEVLMAHAIGYRELRPDEWEIEGLVADPHFCTSDFLSRREKGDITKEMGVIETIARVPEGGRVSCNDKEIGGPGDELVFFVRRFPLSDTRSSILDGPTVFCEEGRAPFTLDSVSLSGVFLVSSRNPLRLANSEAHRAGDYDRIVEMTRNGEFHGWLPPQWLTHVVHHPSGRQIELAPLPQWMIAGR